MTCRFGFIGFCRLLNIANENYALYEDDELRCEEPDVSDESEEEDVKARNRRFKEHYQNVFRHRQLDKFRNAGGPPCDACRDLLGKGSQKSFSFQGLLEHASNQRGLRHSAYNEVLKEFVGEPGGAAAGEGDGQQQGLVKASVKVTRGPRAASEETLGISKPPLVTLANTRTFTNSKGEIGGLNGPGMKKELQKKGYNARAAFSTYRKGGCNNFGYAVFEDSDDGLREAATFARDMEKAGFGREGWHGGGPELLVDLDGSKILYAWIPLKQVTTAAD
jgi:hypothetical protein